MRRHATVSRPCQCGEPVVADSLLASDVWLAVRRHNVGGSHQAVSGAGGRRGGGGGGAPQGGTGNGRTLAAWPPARVREQLLCSSKSASSMPMGCSRRRASRTGSDERWNGDGAERTARNAAVTL